MSHSGWSTSNYVSALAGSIPSATGLTLHCRYNPSSVSAANRDIFAVLADSSNFFAIRVATAVAQARTVAAGAGSSSAGASLSTGTWYSLAAQYISPTSRTIFVDGVAGTTNTTSRTPSATSIGRIGYIGSGAAAAGSIAEAAIYNIALSADEVAALVFKSPLSVRPDALVAYLKLLDNGTRDEVALPATVTGTLTKDTDHPRVYYQRRSSGIWAPNFTTGGGTISGEADQQLAPYTKTQTGTLTLKGSASQTLAPYSQTATGKAIITGQQ